MGEVNLLKQKSPHSAWLFRFLVVERSELRGGVGGLGRRNRCFRGSGAGEHAQTIEMKVEPGVLACPLSGRVDPANLLPDDATLDLEAELLHRDRPKTVRTRHVVKIVLVGEDENSFAGLLALPETSHGHFAHGR